MAKTGRPPKYKSKEEIEGLIEQYFRECEGKVLEDKDGKPVLNKYGRPVIIGEKPPTVTGLALALGFTSRQALLNYEAKVEFFDTITRAKSRIEEYTEGRLFDRDGSNGARFSLANNFRGWSEKPRTELDEEEQRARIASVKAQTQALEDKKTDKDASGLLIVENMETLAEVLKRSRPNREIQDYEE